MLTPSASADISTLTKEGYEIANCQLSFEQGFDDTGKARIKVRGGAIHLVLSMIPSNDMIEWMLHPRKYKDGVIVLLDDENIPLQKIFFHHAICIDMEISYTQKGTGYASVGLLLQAEKIVTGSGITFDNEWTES